MESISVLESLQYQYHKDIEDTFLQGRKIYLLIREQKKLTFSVKSKTKVDNFKNDSF